VTRTRKGCPTARSKPIGEWRLREERHYQGDRYLGGGEVQAEPASIVVEQADMIDTKLNTRYAGGSFRVRLKNVPDMRTKTFVGESAWSSAAAYASDAASKCGDWRWWPDL
jgi:hypothetical protein